MSLSLVTGPTEYIRELGNASVKEMFSHLYTQTTTDENVALLSPDEVEVVEESRGRRHAHVGRPRQTEIVLSKRS